MKSKRWAWSYQRNLADQVDQVDQVDQADPMDQRAQMARWDQVDQMDLMAQTVPLALARMKMDPHRRGKMTKDPPLFPAKEKDLLYRAVMVWTVCRRWIYRAVMRTVCRR